MAESNPQATPALTKTMDNIVALCRRRGFIFQSSEIYGGINGFWDYGPLGVELKRNLKEAWWHDIVRAPGKGPDGNLIDMVGVDCSIIMNPKVWVASGHAAGFNDPMVDDKETKHRFRADKAWVVGFFTKQHLQENIAWLDQFITEVSAGDAPNLDLEREIASESVRAGTADVYVAAEGDSPEQGLVEAVKLLTKRQAESLGLRDLFNRARDNPTPALERLINRLIRCHNQIDLPQDWPRLSPSTQRPTLTEPRQFNLMFETFVGAMQSDDSKAFLRPETAQGIFANFKNVTDTSRVKVPFGIAQVGKAFRNEVTPRNFTFRSREFEQMEIEFFIRPDSAKEWYAFWRDTRFNWWKSVGLAGDNLQLREHDKDELAHYAKDGAGTSDIEYKFPFTAPGFGELEGVAHRTDFDLRQHAQHSGLGDKLKYFDQELQVKMQGEGRPKEEIAEKSKYFPHVIEPSAGADRGTLALLCEAFTPDASRPSGVFMKFHPRMAPIKAGIFPLVNKDGMPEVAEKLYLELRQKYAVQFDEKQTIGKRYARMDEAGTPYCFTIDGETLSAGGGGGAVTVRHRDTQTQERVALDKVGAFLAEKIGG